MFLKSCDSGLCDLQAHQAFFRLVAKLNDMLTDLSNFAEELSGMHGHGVLHGFKRKLLASKLLRVSSDSDALAL